MRIYITCNAAQQSEGGCITAILIDHALVSSLRGGYGEGDGLMELPPPWLYCDYGRYSYTISKELCGQLGGYHVSLKLYNKIAPTIHRVKRVSFHGVDHYRSLNIIQCKCLEIFTSIIIYLLKYLNLFLSHISLQYDV